MEYKYVSMAVEEEILCEIIKNMYELSFDVFNLFF